MARTVRSKGSPWTSTSARQNFFMSLEQSISQARLQNLGQNSHYSILLQVLSWVRSLTQHPDFSKAPKQVPREKCNNRVSMYSISCKPSSVSNKLETLGMRYAQFLCTQQPFREFLWCGLFKQIHQSSTSLPERRDTDFQGCQSTKLLCGIQTNLL